MTFHINKLKMKRDKNGLSALRSGTDNIQKRR